MIERDNLTLELLDEQRKKWLSRYYEVPGWLEKIERAFGKESPINSRIYRVVKIDTNITLTTKTILGYYAKPTGELYSIHLSMSLEGNDKTGYYCRDSGRIVTRYFTGDQDPLNKLGPDHKNFITPGLWLLKIKSKAIEADKELARLGLDHATAEALAEYSFMSMDLAEEVDL